MKTEKDFYFPDIREIERDLYRNGTQACLDSQVGMAI